MDTRALEAVAPAAMQLAMDALRISVEAGLVSPARIDDIERRISGPFDQAHMAGTETAAFFDAQIRPVLAGLRRTAAERWTG